MKVIAGTDTEWIKSHPEFADTFQGYLLGDEPDLTPTSENPDSWKARGDAIRAADPSRDVYGNFGRSFCDYPGGGAFGRSEHGLPEVHRAADDRLVRHVLHDRHQLQQRHVGLRRGRRQQERWAPGTKVVGFVEASAPFEDGGRITATQLKQAAWEVVVHGADGLEYFCHDFQGGGFIEDGCLAQTGIPAAMTEVDNEIQGYADVLARPDVSGTTATGRVTTLTKSFDGSTYVFALSDGNSSTPNGFSGSSTIDVAGIDTGTATVVGEGRTLPVSGGSFTDTLSGYQHHVYKIVGGAGPDPTRARPPPRARARPPPRLPARPRLRLRTPIPIRPASRPRRRPAGSTPASR